MSLFNYVSNIQMHSRPGVYTGPNFICSLMKRSGLMHQVMQYTIMVFTDDSPIHGLSFRPIPMVVGALMLKRWIVQNDFYRSESFEIVARFLMCKLGVLPVASVSRANRCAAGQRTDWLYFQSKRVKRLICTFFLVRLH